MWGFRSGINPSLYLICKHTRCKCTCLNTTILLTRSNPVRLQLNSSDNTIQKFTKNNYGGRIGDRGYSIFPNMFFKHVRSFHFGKDLIIWPLEDQVSESDTIVVYIDFNTKNYRVRKVLGEI